MPGSWPQNQLPHLTAVNCQVTSPSTPRYNCIAWAAGNDSRWWWPDAMGVSYWPRGIDRTVTTATFIRAYGTLGYTLCFDGGLEAGIEKIALLGIGPQGEEVPTHAARQLQNGEWTSKLGPLEDITHSSADDVRGPVYGRVLCYLSRPRR